ncbi:hypothetical protein [Bradyrhizobium sp. 41S5]|uniref:hypothetical protein n=1 Tax=Bradyrhizobium sp. 41S5 TaxID=1404443 RepID=UPI00156B3DBA
MPTTEFDEMRVLSQDIGSQMSSLWHWSAKISAAAPLGIRATMNSAHRALAPQGEVLHHRLDRVALDILHRLVGTIGREIDAGPTREQSELPGLVDMCGIVREQVFGFCPGRRDDHGRAGEEADERVSLQSISRTVPVLWNGRFARRTDKGNSFSERSLIGDGISRSEWYLRSGRRVARAIPNDES